MAATFRRPPTDHKGPFTQTRRVAALRYEKCKKRFYSARDRGAEYCDDRVCVSLRVYLSVRKHISGNTRPLFTRFLCILPMAVARSSSGGVAIRYVLPVLCMTSLADKPRQLNVAAQLMEAQSTCSLGLGYKRGV